MNIVELNDPSAVAQEAVRRAIDVISGAISERGSAVWILAGGTSPMLAYEIIKNTETQIDWSKVSIAIGDERMVSLDNKGSNWGTISKILFNDSAIKNTVKIIPAVNLTPEAAAQDYENKLLSLPKDPNGNPIIDLAWIGMGEDGHTLSLFPNHPSSEPTNKLVIPVFNSPKMPPTRTTLTQEALKGVANLVIFCTGESKHEALKNIINGDPLPVSAVAQTVEQNGGSAVWLVDKSASEG